MLNNLGFQNVDVVENGLQAVQAVTHKKYAVVFMDIMVKQL